MCSSICYDSPVPIKPGRKPHAIPPAQRRRLHTAAQNVTAADEEMRAAVHDAHHAGGSIRAIATEINRSTRTIQNWLHHTPTTDDEARRSPADPPE